MRGERAVGEEINRLTQDGCSVFHDVPIGPYGNVDHVIVSRIGVFAVETKTRRKREIKKAKGAMKVIFNGKSLEFPNRSDEGAVEQTRMQAQRLKKLLSKAVGEAVPVRGILAIRMVC